jgi:hypothetical protein
MRKILILSAVILLGGCSTLGLSEPNCFESVAVSKIAIAEAYSSSADASEAELISVGQAKEALTILDSADALADQASGLCSIDEKAASDYLKAISASLADVSTILTEK